VQLFYVARNLAWKSRILDSNPVSGRKLRGLEKMTFEVLVIYICP
jgi:hypothetical protein